MPYFLNVISTCLSTFSSRWQYLCFEWAVCHLVPFGRKERVLPRHLWPGWTEAHYDTARRQLWVSGTDIKVIDVYNPWTLSPSLFLPSQELVRQVLSAIRAVAGNDDVKDAVVKAGGVQLIVIAMNRHVAISAVSHCYEFCVLGPDW